MGIALAALRWRRKAAAIAFVFLLIVTIVYSIHLALVGPPKCNCFGKLLAFRYFQGEWPIYLVRNGILVICLSLPSVVAGARASVAKRTALANAAPGFTLLETLVSLAIISLLVVLIAPNLGAVRRSARTTSALASLSGHSRVFATYSMDNREFAPAITDPVATSTVLRVEDFVFEFEYFRPMDSWHIALADPYYHASFQDRAFVEPGHSPSVVTTFTYSPTFLADPTFWRPETRRSDRSQLRPTRLTEVLFPDKKGMLLARETYQESPSVGSYGHDVAPLSFVDGSVAVVLGRNQVRGYPTGLGQWYQNGVYAFDIAGLMTLDGIRGTDRR